MALFGSQSSSGSGNTDQMNESGNMDQQTMSTAERKGGDLGLMLSVASVLLSWYEFYGRGNKAEGIFIGLWPPTFMAFATYLKIRGLEDQLESTPFFGSDAGKALRRLLS